MSRALSSAAWESIAGQETDKVWAILLTIEHDDLDAPIRVTDDPKERIQVTDDEVVYGLTSRGEDYIALPFSIALPEDTDEEVPSVQLRIDNIDRRIVDAVRSISSPPTVTLEVVLSDSPDTVEYGPVELTLTNCTFDAFEVKGQLQQEDLLNDRYPSTQYLPSNYPALFV